MLKASRATQNALAGGVFAGA